MRFNSGAATMLRVAAVAGLLLAPLAPGAAARAETEIQAGVASVDITPREPVWMAGFASRDKPSQSVAAPLRAKALAIRDSAGNLTVIVTSDLIGIRRAVADIVARRCLDKYGLARERLLLNASHTHSGPELSLGGSAAQTARSERQQVTERYTSELLDKLVHLVGEAIGGLAPAKLEFGQGLAGFAVNRRRSRPNTRHLPGPVDHDVPVLSVRAPDGSFRAILFGYACHPTTLSAYVITPDYPGYAQAEIEKLYPGSVALFLQGCGADSNPLPRFHSEDPILVRRSLELSESYGKVLAAAVDLTLRGKLTPVAGPIHSAFEIIDIPFEPLPARADLDQRRASADVNLRSQAERLLRTLDSGTTPPARQPYAIQVWQFGASFKLIALAGEVVVDYALRLKAAHGWDTTWMAAYSNDIPGYIPSRRVLSEGGYETGGGPGGAYSAEVEDIIAAKVGALVRQTKP